MATKFLSLSFFLFPLTFAFAAPPWEDPAVNAENRLESRTYLPPTDGVRTLAGDWQFWWTGTPDHAPAGFERPDFDDGAWFKIAVPGCVETQGWGVPHYVNIRNPFAGQPPEVDPAYNPTMYYRTKFEVPSAWHGRRIVLRFEGVASCGEVWVNGRRVGYFEDSRLPSEFDITDCLDFSNSASNLLAVLVRKWCDGSHAEDQDMIRYAGIFRDVKLLGEPKTGIVDFKFTTEPDTEYRQWRCELEIVGGESDIPPSAALFEADGAKIGDFAVVAAGRYRLELTSPRLWSDEDPYLYTLEMAQGNDIRRVKVGIRRAEIKNGLFLVNGRPIKLKGVNRHEMNVATGYTIPYEDMVADVRMMKQNNINCVRTSHYPFDARWYDLCDEYGIYLCAEANFEAHALGHGPTCMLERPEWWQTLVERNVRQVLTYRNHPSIVMWSYGNESGYGRGIAKVREAIRKLDPVTPFHGVGFKLMDKKCLPDWEHSDMTGGQYQPLGFCRERIRDDKPFFMMEYACAMGTGMGNFREYWDVFYENDKLSGGCLWDWIDQAMWIDTDRTDTAGKRIRYLGYGGDHDESPNDGPFCANGLLDVFRHPSAKLNEVKHVQQPIEVGTGPIKGVGTDPKNMGTGPGWESLEIENRYEFTYADELLEGRWELHEEGIKISEGTFKIPHLAPRTRGKLQIPWKCVLQKLGACPQRKWGQAPRGERFGRVAFVLKKDTQWAKKGYEVAWKQIPLGTGPGGLGTDPGGLGTGPEGLGTDPEMLGTGPEIVVEETPEDVRVACGRTKAVFSRKTGTVSRLEMAGQVVMSDLDGIVHGPRLQVIRAWTDSDNWLRSPFIAAGLAHLTHHPRPIWVAGNCVTCPVRVTGVKSGGFEFSQTWQFLTNGSIRVTNVMEPFGKVPELPRVGVFMRLEGGYEELTYYGRGPWANYVDRFTGCDIARWTTTVTEQGFQEGVRPQDCGSHIGVRWAEFANRSTGGGVRFTAEGSPLILQALHFTAEDLDQSRHRPGEPRRYFPLVPRAETCLSLDCRQMGLGCNNCGPRPLPQYHFPVEKTEWSYVISAKDRTESPQELVLAERGRGSAYRIVLPAAADPTERFAAEELRDHLRQITGVELPIVEAATDDGKPGIRLSSGKGDIDGFAIRSEGRDLAIRGQSPRGTLFAVYELLERFGGCGWYAPWRTVVPKAARFAVPAPVDIAETPSFAWRQPSWYGVRTNRLFAARCRFNAESPDGSVPHPDPKFGGYARPFVSGLYSSHTHYVLIPPEKYFKDHPEWFSLCGGERRSAFGQLCTSNPEVIEEAARRALEMAAADPAARTVGVSQMDWGGVCECENCRAILREEGAGSGLALRFVNAVAERIERTRPDLTVETLIYSFTIDPPKKVRPRRNVMLCCCVNNSARESFVAPTIDCNRRWKAAFEFWSSVCRDIMIWDYTPSFYWSFMPFPNARVYAPNLCYYRSRGAKGIYMDGQPRAGADFGDFKNWLQAKLAWNPDQSVAALQERFMRGCYGEGAPFVRKILDLQYAALDAHPEVKFTVTARDFPTIFTEEYADRVLELWNRAESAVADDPSARFAVRLGKYPALILKCIRIAQRARPYVVTRHPERYLRTTADRAVLAYELAIRTEAAARGITLCHSHKLGRDLMVAQLVEKLRQPEVSAAADRLTVGVEGFEVYTEDYSGGVWNERPRSSRIVEDPTARTGRAVVETAAASAKPAVIFQLGYLAHDDVPYRLRARMKASGKVADDGEIARIVIWNEPRQEIVRARSVRASELDGEWKWVDFGELKLSDDEDVRIFAATPDSPRIAESFSVDAIEFSRSAK